MLAIFVTLEGPPSIATIVCLSLLLLLVRWGCRVACLRRARRAKALLPTMHYLDPASLAPDPEPMEEVVTSEAVPVLHPALAGYQSYLVFRGSRGFESWAVQEGYHVTPELEGRLELPRCLRSNPRLTRSTTPIADLLAGDKFLPADVTAMRNVADLLRSMGLRQDVAGRSSVSNVPPVALAPAQPPVAQLAQAREESPLPLPGYGGFTPKVMAAMETPPRMRLDQLFAASHTVVMPAGFHTLREASLLCEVLVIGCAYGIHLGPSTVAMARHRGAWAQNPNLEEHRKWEGWRVITLAASHCDSRGYTWMRDLAATIVAMRPVFRDAAVDYLFMRVGDEQASVLAWIGTLDSPAMPSVPVWTKFKLSAARQSFVAPYLDAQGLCDAADALRTFAATRGVQMEDEQVELLVRSMNYFARLIEKFDRAGMNSARAVNAHATAHWHVVQDQLRGTAWFMDTLAYYACEHTDAIDMYVCQFTMMDACKRGVPHGPEVHWQSLVSAVCWMQREFETSRGLMLDRVRDGMVLGTSPAYVPRPHELVQNSVDVLCESVEAFGAPSRQFIVPEMWLEQSGRVAYGTGMFLCVVVEFIDKQRPRYATPWGKFDDDLQRNVEVIVRCMRNVGVAWNDTDMGDFCAHVAQDAIRTSVYDSFLYVWRMWLAHFAEAMLYCRAKDAPIMAKDFEIKANGLAYERDSPLGTFLDDAPAET